ncbi:hypothetical protein PDJAM_G00004580, partial [Pangasius djambal]|nr:hypothetical protein [Pangasius djambal]
SYSLSLCLSLSLSLSHTHTHTRVIFAGSTFEKAAASSLGAASSGQGEGALSLQLHQHRRLEDAFHAEALRSGETRSSREQRRPRGPCDSHSSSPYKDAKMDSEGDENRAERCNGNP